MKKSKLNLALLAIILGVGAAFTSFESASAKQGSVLWGQQKDGTWIQTTLTAHCFSSTKICKEDFPSGQNPNMDSSGGTVVQANGQLNQ